MKRIVLILLSVLICAFLITSCEPQKPVEEVADYFAKGASGKTYKELKGTIDEEITFVPGNYTFDLNGETLNIKGIVLPEAEKEYTVTIKNGTINGVAYNAFTQYSNSHLILDNITVDWKSEDVNAACFLYQGSNPVWLEVKDSTLKNNVYGIGTNAEKGTDYVYVTVDNSTVTTTSSDQDNTAILFNVPGKLNISNSTISGERQGVIVRGGEATISNSTIISSGDRTDYTDYSNIEWSAGNEVPLAALVIGNRSNAYKYPTTVTLDNVTLSTPKEETERKLMYVYQSEGAPEVTVRGTLNGLYDAEAKENKRIFFNDATSIKSLGLFNLAANRANTKGKTVTIELGNEEFKDIAYSEHATGYTGKGLLIGNRSLNSYNSTLVTNDEDKLTLVIEGGSVTSDSRGFKSINRVAEDKKTILRESTDSIYMLIPNGNSDIIFKNVEFNNVFSFDWQSYTGPWSNFKSLTFDSCTFNGIIIGQAPAEDIKITNCTFNKYINEVDNNNSNPIWWQASVQQEGYSTMKTFTFTNNKVESTRPVKIERIGNNISKTPFVYVSKNHFDISRQENDTKLKNMGMYIGDMTGDSFKLYDEGNTKSENTKSIYTFRSKDQYDKMKLVDANGTEISGTKADATLWYTGEAF